MGDAICLVNSANTSAENWGPLSKTSSVGIPCHAIMDFKCFTTSADDVLPLLFENFTSSMNLE